jgi:hypothetical protein
MVVAAQPRGAFYVDVERLYIAFAISVSFSGPSEFMPIPAPVQNWVYRTAARIGIDKGGRWLGSVCMKLSGIEFFPDRSALEKSRSIDEQLATASDVVGVFIIGRKFRQNYVENSRRLSRLILPRPDAESVRHYATSVDDIGHFQRSIVETTKALQERGTTIRWHPEIIQYSMILGDINKHSGWAQIECAMPFSKSNQRPSFTVKRNGHEMLATALSDAFERMWNNSAVPDPSVIERYLIANKLSRGTFAATFFLATMKAIGRQMVNLEEV